MTAREALATVTSQLGKRDPRSLTDEALDGDRYEEREEVADVLEWAWRS